MNSPDSTPEDAAAQILRLSAELAAANARLAEATSLLDSAKGCLINSERLAAFGKSVAGVAHDLNTPIGNGMTAVTTIRNRVAAFQVAMANGLKRSALEEFVDGMARGCDIALHNLQRASELAVSFKQLSVDQVTAQRRKFSLAALAKETLVALHPTLKSTPFLVETDIAADLSLDSYPGPLGQALTNLINNALIHGFGQRDHGTIRISARTCGNEFISLMVRDDGEGIPPEHLGHVFEPFYTTRAGQGGTGLGLHIVHDIVTITLGGTIVVKSDEGSGTEFAMTLPRCAPLPADNNFK